MTTELKSMLGGTITVTNDERGHPKFYELSGGNVEQENRNLLPFQSGNPDTVGLNGFTYEDLLMVMLHRMSFSNADYPSTFNVAAMEHMKQAQQALQRRYHITTAARNTDLTKHQSTFTLDRDNHELVFNGIGNIPRDTLGHFVMLFEGSIFYGRTPSELLQNVRLANTHVIEQHSEEIGLLTTVAMYAKNNEIESVMSIADVHAMLAKV